MEILALLPLALLVYSDAKYRFIDIRVLLCFSLLQVVAVLLGQGLGIFFFRLIVNTVVLLFLFLGVTLYFRLWKGKRPRELLHYVGMGDVFFLFSLVPSLNPLPFARFVWGALCLSWLSWVFYFRRCSSSSIPLVSTVGVCHAMCVLVRRSFPFLFLSS